ncbi:DUF2938 family protein [Alloyangia pacifica]|uniref:DUF2938 family protein n=1 Tax=Alloyangia pacifica TaxID=311180 RepID=UPI001CFC5FFC|nr:DUF2938 family protein [Alloyangia pacifica]
MSNFLVCTLILGIGATVFSDLWQWAFLRITEGKAPNWSSVGRWVLGFREGRVMDPDLGTRPALPGENAVGWVFHYIVGIGYGGLYLACLALFGAGPTLGNALLFGAITLAAPMLFMKPCMGGGLFGMRAAKPWRGALKTVSAHLSFGLGLWIVALLT